jgi:enterochelin esterase-like enzyme
VSELVTETFGYDGGRLVTAYLPTGAPEAIVYAGDGEIVVGWAGDLESADVPPTMVVGLHRASDESVRLQEYSPGFEPERFAAHEEFVLHDVRRWVQIRFGVSPSPDRTAVYGVSAGAELALALGLRHADVFGCVLGASPGAGYQPPETMSDHLPRTYLVAGTQEPFFLANAERWVKALGAAGADVVLTRREGAHGDPFWRRELPAMVAWAFGGGAPGV